MFKIKLKGSETLQVTCSKSVKQEELLVELQVKIPFPENHCHLLQCCENTSVHVNALRLSHKKKLTDTPCEQTPSGNKAHSYSAMVSMVEEFPDFKPHTHGDN